MHNRYIFLLHIAAWKNTSKISELQKEVKSNPKQPSCNKSVRPMMKKDIKIQGNSQEMAMMVN